MFCITFSATTTETGDPIAIPCNLFVVYTVVLYVSQRFSKSIMSSVGSGRGSVDRGIAV